MDLQNNIKRSMPMIPLRGLWILPNSVIQFDAGRDFSIKAIEKSKNRDNILFITTQIDPVSEEKDIENFRIIGVISRIKQSVKMPDGSIRVLVEGLQRARLTKYIEDREYFEVEVEEIIPTDEYNHIQKSAIKELALSKLQDFSNIRADISLEFIYKLQGMEDLHRFSDFMASALNIENLEEVQSLVEENNAQNRILRMINWMSNEIQIIEYQNNISGKVKHKLNDSQREYFLREQLQVVKAELERITGQENDEEDNYTSKIKELQIKEEYKEKLLKEVSRLESTPSGSPEANVIRTYLDTVLEVPFGKYTEDRLDIKESRKLLDKDHHSLEDVKERILEFLAVLSLKKDMKGSILCLVGPPGVGKTSIVKSVAESMNREYISMRLGGMADESEIRGHRKTYIGAMPGRIITSLQRAKTLNPVFLLDEIDKLASSHRDDPASALLEVLDPNQNSEFVDRYIELPVDLSKVMFVTTANSISTIPTPLLDRMEVIQLSGYTEYDKAVIAKKYLVPKQVKEHGLKSSQINISDSVIKVIIKNYTREAGVRNLERQIAKVCRKAAMRIVEGEDKVSVNLKNYKEFLGKEKVLDDDIVKTAEVGVVTGLAWTSVGGELLQIEVNTMPGKGKVQLTGSLGDVMKESAIAAISYIKSNKEAFGINSNLDEVDIHVHVPEGATPKDGPSAGITITTGIVSALTNIKVRQDIAMTGEVTIRGRVLPIGGLKEKALAAKRYGINRVIIPKQNERDIDDIPEAVREEIEFYPVSHIGDVLKLALDKEL